MTQSFFTNVYLSHYIFMFFIEMIWHSKTEHDQTRQKAKKLLLSQKQLSAENKQLKEAQEKMNSELEDKNERLKIYENESIKDKGTIGQIQNQLIDEQEMFRLFSNMSELTSIYNLNYFISWNWQSYFLNIYQKKTATLNQQIVQLSSELSQSTADCSMINQKVAELQAAHEQALQASEQSAEQLNSKLIEHEKFR